MGVPDTGEAATGEAVLADLTDLADLEATGPLDQALDALELEVGLLDALELFLADLDEEGKGRVDGNSGGQR